METEKDALKKENTSLREIKEMLEQRVESLTENMQTRKKSVEIGPEIESEELELPTR